MDKIHFIGIGGIGMSALAQYYISEGFEVSGSDLVQSSITDSLKGKGVKMHIGEPRGELISPDMTKVVYTPAVEGDNPELQKAKELGIQTLKYPEALGELTRKYFTLAVSGTHGKSTTTSMLALMMVEAGLDPTVIVGTQLAEFGGSNFRKGEGEYLVIEADEYDRSFWNYQPKVALVTNIDEDHLDTYGDMQGVLDGFKHYLKNLPKESIAILNAQDPHTEEMTEGLSCQLGFFNNEADKLDWPLQIPGGVNQLNAELAWQGAKLVGVEKEQAEEAIKKFKGTWRRLEKMSPIKREYGNTIFFNDYGHHPTEVKATLSALKGEYSDRKLSIIFQPHQVRRTTSLFNEFVDAFEDADNICLLPVYQVAGREDVEGKSSKDLYEAIKAKREELGKSGNVFYKKTFEETLPLLREGVVVFMGAGDVDSKVRQYFYSELNI